MMESSNPIAAFIMLIAAFVIYFLPTFVAAKRRHPNGTSIFLLDLFLGWTLLGWVAALVWSASSVKPESKVSKGGEAHPIAGDRYQKLEKIAALRESGHLTYEEFEREKSRLLNS
ncbi:superinfection immunity protein [Pseudomonas putida]|uniref:superinfection immunity protein n=1 Tax=Pseudomonas putida TaxID=303 RepID=UPI00125F6809|nr:superinfection immunity protein [Pseudomonas putida]KAB5626293.1 superinfection immunity protein [Pseudomonas putida]